MKTLALCIAAATVLSATTADFEQFTDGDLLTSQISGLTFSNAVVFSAGISLNEIEFPPHSGQNVISDSGGPIQIGFVTPVAVFGGYVTYTTGLSVQGFDSFHNLLGSVSSKYSANFAGSGVVGSSSNEFLQISSPAGIAQVVITGDPTGGSFVLDDISFTEVPEPSFVLILGSLIALLALGLRSTKREF